MAGGFYQRGGTQGVPGFDGDGETAPAGKGATAKGATGPAETSATTITSQGLPDSNSFQRGGSQAGAQQGGSMTMPRQFQGMAQSNPKLASAVQTFNTLPAEGKATIGRLANFVAQNPAVTEKVVTNLPAVLTGEMVIPGFDITQNEPGAQAPQGGGGVGGGGEAGGNSTAPSGNTPPPSGPQAPPPSPESSGAQNANSPPPSNPESSGNQGSGGGGGGYGGGEASGYDSGGSSTPAGAQNLGLGGTGIPPGADVEELAFVVLMNATNDQDNDLQEIMNEVQAQTNAKQFLRQQMQQVNNDVANNASQQTKDANGQAITPTPAFPTPINQQFYSQFQMPNATDNGVTYYNVDLTSGQPLTTIDQLKSIQQNLQGDLDSMNEMSEMTSMRLQMAMDRRSQFVQSLTNVLKKIDDTQSAITQNLK